MGCTHSSAAGTVEGRADATSSPRRFEAKFVPPRPGQLYVRPEEHKKPSEETSQDADEIADWKGLWRPSSIDEAGSLLVRQLRLQDRCCEDQAGALLDVLCNAFHSDSACVAIMEPPMKVLVWSGRGLCKTGAYAPWMLDFLQCCLNSPHHEVAIVKNASKDARVKDSDAVACDGGVASFCGAPLIAANGVCIGALCIFRGEPTRYNAVPVALLAGMAELMMRQLEAQSAKEHPSAKGLLRPKAAYEAATMLVDASHHAWKVLYIDSQASSATGVSVHMAGASTFWGLFSSPDAPGDQPWKAYADQTENSVDFMLRNIQRRGSSNHTVFSLAFTPLTKVMDECTIPIGIPCMTEAQVGSRNFFFVRVDVQTDALPEQRTPQQAVPIPGLELGTLLAASPYGRTHRGFYKGQPVAVKIVANGRRNVRQRDGRPLAMAVTEGLRESGVPLVRTYQYAAHSARARSSLLGKPDQVPGIPEGEVCTCGEVIANCACEALEDDRRSLCQMSDSACSLNGGDHSAQETWLVQEYCSLGTLQLAIAQGKFQKSNGRACCTAILDVACDIAYAMHLLHSQGVTHGNLSSSNVLLLPSSKHSYGFRAKVSDYGILRELEARGFATPQCYPTLAHLAPEVLLHGKVSKAADVYAFGVLLWEMAAGQRMFAGMPWAQVMAAVTLRHSRPRLPPGRAMPAGLESVLRMCLVASPAERPGFSELTHIIRAVRTSGLHKAAKKRHSMAVERADKRCSMAAERAGHQRSSSASRDSGPSSQEGAEATRGAGPTNMKQAAATLWGSDSWRQRSLKPEALSEWQGRCNKAAAQGPTKSAQLGSSSSRPARCPQAGEREEAPRARSFPAAEKPNSPYNSVTKAKAANMRLSIEVRRAGLTGKPRAPGHGQPAPAQAKPAGLPPSLLYQSSRPHSASSSGDKGSRSGSGERPQKDMQQHLGSKGSSKHLSALPGDDRLGLNEVARMKGSLGGAVGSYSGSHSESGFTHTAAHLSFTEIKQQKSKNLAAGLSALRDSLLPETERVNSCTEARSNREFVSLADTKYVPSGSLEKMSSVLPQIRVSSSCYRY